MQELLRQVNEDGYCVVENFLEGQPLKELQSTAMEYLENSTDPYKFGRAKRILRPQQDVLKFFDCPLVNFFNREWNCRINNVFITEETKAYELDKNGYVHKDVKFCLKYLIYGADVDENCAPLTLYPGSNVEGDKIHKAGTSRLASDYPGLLDNFEEKQILGPAGTLIIFSTNCFHKASLIKGDGYRLVVRAHCWL